ncbi:MAG: hypothetical protein E4G90_01400 [Gemmatimonadales bacterium]|nr:MAG: hypothetical protein E4G90_01400 [Gemmatimonadales bacterium]
MRHHHSVWKEGVVAGLLGAVAVAIWFLGLDLIEGRPLFTPSVLGQILFLGGATPEVSAVQTNAVLLYTLFHLVAFVLFGLLVTKLVHLAIILPALRFGLVMLFVVFEVFFWGFTYMFFAGTRGLFPRGAMLVANTLAAIVMATYLWHRHPSLKRALRHEALGS